jgi:transposase InsO family protein
VAFRSTRESLARWPPTSAKTITSRHGIHGWVTTATAIGIDEVLTAIRSPWLNAYAERLIGSRRRKCLDHIIIGNERGLRRALHAYVEYYLKPRTHLSLSKDAPVPRPVASPSDGDIVAISQLAGLHYRYERRAA